MWSRAGPAARQGYGPPNPTPFLPSPPPSQPLSSLVSHAAGSERHVIDAQFKLHYLNLVPVYILTTSLFTYS